MVDEMFTEMRISRGGVLELLDMSVVVSLKFVEICCSCHPSPLGGH